MVVLTHSRVVIQLHSSYIKMPSSDCHQNTGLMIFKVIPVYRVVVIIICYEIKNRGGLCASSICLILLH